MINIFTIGIRLIVTTPIVMTRNVRIRIIPVMTVIIEIVILVEIVNLVVSLAQ